MLRLAVLASGRGSNLQAILRSISRGNLDARVVMALSNVPDAPALELARAAGIPLWTEDHRKFRNRKEFDKAMLAAMAGKNVDAVVLAGYMRLLSTEFLQTFPGRVLNLHPSLLPAFPGTDGAGETLAYGARFAGCTVHFVEEALDMGPVIIQAALAVRDDERIESLMPRIQALEHRIYPQALHWLATGRLSRRGRLVHVRQREPDDRGHEHAELPDGCMVNPPLEKGF